MKNLITTIASVLIIMTFLSQMLANEKTYLRLYISDSIIDKYLESGNMIDNEQMLKKEIDEKLSGKVRVDEITKRDDEYDIHLSYFDVIGPERIIGYEGENVARRVRTIHFSPEKEETDIP